LDFQDLLPCQSLNLESARPGVVEKCHAWAETAKIVNIQDLFPRQSLTRAVFCPSTARFWGVPKSLAWVGIAYIAEFETLVKLPLITPDILDVTSTLIGSTARLGAVNHSDGAMTTMFIVCR